MPVGGVILDLGGPRAIDPLLSIAISLYVLRNVLGNLRQVLRVLLRRAPSSFDVGAFEAQLTGIAAVRSLRHTHVRTPDGRRHLLTAHVVMRPGASRDDVLKLKGEVRRLLRSHHFGHVTVDVELEGEPCVAERDPEARPPVNDVDAG